MKGAKDLIVELFGVSSSCFLTDATINRRIAVSTDFVNHRLVDQGERQVFQADSRTTTFSFTCSPRPVRCQVISCPAYSGDTFVKVFDG